MEMITVNRNSNDNRVVHPHNPILDHTRLVGKSDSIGVYIRSDMAINPPPGSNKPPVLIPYTKKVQNFEQQDARQILDGFDQDNSRLSQDFGQPEIKSFKVAVDNVRDVGLGTEEDPFSPGDPEGAFHYVPSAPDPNHPGVTDKYDPNIIQVMPGSASPKKFASRHEALGLTDAEAIESYEFRTKYWNPGRTNGEALSRALSDSLQPNIAKDPAYTSNPEKSWWKDGHKDYINGNPDYGNPFDGGDRKQASDQNYDSNGAGQLFLDYLHNGLGFSWKEIVHNGAPTLGGTYVKLMAGRGVKTTGKQGFDNFVAALSRDQNKKGALNLPADGNPFSVTA